MSKKFRSFLSILLVVILAVSSIATVSVSAVSEADVQSIVNGLTINNDTTKETFEAELKSALGVDEITWSKEFIKVAALPKVEVKLANGEGGYEVYYTSESYAGSVTGEFTVTLGAKPCTVEVNRIIAPDTEEILCNSIGIHQYTDDNSQTYLGDSELLVVKGRSQDDVAVLKTAQFDAESMKKVKAIIVDGNFRGFQNTKIVDSSENLIGFFAKSSSQPNSGSWGSASTSAGAIHNCPNFKYFYTGSFIDNGGKSINLGARFISGTSRNNLKYLYFNFPGTQLKVDSYAFAFGNTEQVVFNVGSVTGLAAEKVYASSTNIICANTDVYNAFKAVKFAGQPKAIYNMDDVYAVRNTLAENIESIKLNFAGINNITNALSSTSRTTTLISLLNSVLPSGVTASFDKADYIYEAAVDGKVVALYNQETNSNDVLAITTAKNGKATIYADLTVGSETKTVALSVPVYATLVFDSTSIYKQTDISILSYEDTATEITNEDTTTKTVYDRVITGISTDGNNSLLLIDGNDFGAKEGKKVLVKDSAFNGLNNTYNFTSVIVKNVGIGYEVFRNNSQLTTAYIGEGATFVKELWSTATNDNQKAFCNCSNLVYASYSEGNKKIGAMDFYNTKLQGFVIPSTVKTIRYGAFLNANLKAINYAEGCNAKVVSQDTFNGNPSIVSVKLPEGATSLSDRQFANNSLSTLVLPSTLTNVTKSTFHGDFGNLVLVDYAGLSTAQCELFLNSNRTPLRIVTHLDSDLYDYAHIKGIPCVAIGDINTDNKLNVLDLIALKKESLDTTFKADIALDINNDGTFADAADLVALKKLVLKKDNSAMVNNDRETNKLTYLSNTYAKIMQDKEITIAFIGGSITDGLGATSQQANGWPRLICDKLATEYGCTVTERRKSLGGTGSFLANFRYSYEVANDSLEAPDLLFIEFAINDNYEYATFDEVVRYSESLVRSAYESNPKMDIVYVLSFDKAVKTSDYEQLLAHKTVAEKYGLMYIKVADYFYANTDFDVSSYLSDNVHPNDNGYKIYADLIYNSIVNDFPKGTSEIPQIKTKVLPSPMSNYMENPTLVTSKQIDLTSSNGWSYTSNGFSWTGSRYGGYVYSTEVGSVLNFEFEGTDFGIFYNRRTDLGKISIKIDGGEEVIIDASTGSENPKGVPIATNLKYGKHTVEIKLIENAFHIGGLLVN